MFRFLFLFAEPNLSQDFYRFIWDGELIKNGINPYLFLPNTLIEQPDLAIANAKQLHLGMGDLSARHFSNYPPLNQIIFAISSFLGGGSILGSLIIMRLFIISADLGILYFGKKLIQNIGNSNHLAFWYFLNPLVITELTGNLHFEGVMLFFFVWSLYLISMNKYKLAAPIYALSILLKLVPILFLPLFLKHFGFKKSIVFYSLIGITCIACLLPFYSSEFIDNYSQTVGLWFSNFEFNASVYNLVKKIGVLCFEIKPWELVKSYGSLIPKVVIAIALLLTFLRKNQNLETLLSSILILLSSYYFLSSTVHPWYIIFLLILGVFTNYRFPIVWSASVILSYYAYSNSDFKENLWLITIEYCLVLGYLGHEVFKNHNIISRFRKKFNLN
ncbi:glycosyltransferase 87 family protein [Croceitalea rosinachiae]|uniref:Mannosyltransferase n=1 Tax=Croceitalea rosinachiae TaxID=3075596 RepID=A0ABU3AA11_9FLAO|nr:mannosyltransferase [Croceitalea sp. F388]MDT0606723.1 mannosyltransferase [Croceitalea sp. F388]